MKMRRPTESMHLIFRGVLARTYYKLAFAGNIEEGRDNDLTEVMRVCQRRVMPTIRKDHFFFWDP